MTKQISFGQIDEAIAEFVSVEYLGYEELL